MSAKKGYPINKYAPFRFEESLRKYEPPTRKLQKAQPEECKHCIRKGPLNPQSGFKNTLYVTNKKGSLVCKEYRMGRSKRKSQCGQNELCKRRELISQFECSKQNSIIQKGSKRLSQNQATQQKNSDGKREQTSSVNFLMKNNYREEIKQELKKQAESILQQMEHETHAKAKKIKDIDFHIERIEEIHHELLREFFNAPANTQHNQNHIMQAEEPAQPNQQQNQEPPLLAQMPDQGPSSEIHRVNELLKQTPIDNRERGLTQQLVETQLEKKQTTKKSKRRTKERKKKEICHIESRDSRIKLQGDKGPCYLSRRVLSRLYGNLSCEEVRKKVLEVHPYLEDPSQILSMQFGQQVNRKF